MFRFSGRPIFICGWPRGGTRMIANLISRHPDVIASNEVPQRGLLAIYKSLKVLDKEMPRKRNRGEEWKQTRQDYFLNAIANTYICNWNGTRFSNKTPSNEFVFEHILDACWENPPVFVYCVRHPLKVIRSLKNMPWGTPIIYWMLTRMTRSAAKFDRMKTLGADVHLVQIDQVGESHQDRVAFTQSLMDFLALAPAREIDAYVTKWPIAQPASKVLQRGPVTELSDRELARIRRSRRYRALCERFGYQP